MDWIVAKDTLPSGDNGHSLYIVCVEAVFGQKRIGVANYINGKFTNIVLSGGDEYTPEPIVTHWRPMPEEPPKM